MPLIRPAPPPYDPLEWQTRPWAERIRMACQAWAVQGYGTPLAVYLLYALKVAAYVGLWGVWCAFTPGLGDWRSLGDWWFHPTAFGKAVLWSMAFEGLGLGCGSGPLTARYWPPFGGCLYWLRPGTTKLPFWRRLPLLGGTRRTWLDVGLYAAHHVCLFRALTAPALTPELLWPLVVLLPLIGLADRTAFLAHRPEHYYTTLVCLLFADDWIAGAMAVQLAIWIWAAVSKLNRHFPTVIGVMTSNSPLVPFAAIKKAMYRRYPDDLRPSRLATTLAHAGLLLELGFPLLLWTGDGGPQTMLGLGLMLAFHAYITSNVPMAVPIEWNVHVVYGGLLLFGHHAGVRPTDVGSPVLAAFLLVMLIGVPLLGNLRPAWVSFLCAMRYYAGNWAYSVWLFRKDAQAWRKLDALTTQSAWVPDQLARFYDERTVAGLLGKVPAFRHMHLHGRALHDLLPAATGDIGAYEPIDGELIAGQVLGWNFGEGHLHDERLLAAIQPVCGFAPGELRVVMVESQPLFGRTQAWRIVDAADGELARGAVRIADLVERQPWPGA